MGLGKNSSTEFRKCSVCSSEENKPRIIGNYIVELTTHSIRGEDQLVCQGCSRKLKAEESYKKKSNKNKIRFFGFWKK